jgi:hypothetical protein
MDQGKWASGFEGFENPEVGVSVAEEIRVQPPSQEQVPLPPPNPLRCRVVVRITLTYRWVATNNAIGERVC